MSFGKRRWFLPLGAALLAGGCGGATATSPEGLAILPPPPPPHQPPPPPPRPPMECFDGDGRVLPCIRVTSR